MEFLTELWLAILVSGVAVFIVSSIHHMVLPLHRSDYGKLPDEEKLLGQMRQHAVKPGTYMFPACKDLKDAQTPEAKARFEKGPVGTMVVIPSGVPQIGKNLLQWFVLTLVIGVFVAYLTHLALPWGASFMDVFQVAGAAATLGYAFGTVNDSIWKGVRWGITLKFIFDGIMYGIATGLVFAWLWPAAA